MAGQSTQYAVVEYRIGAEIAPDGRRGEHLIEYTFPAGVGEWLRPDDAEQRRVAARFGGFWIYLDGELLAGFEAEAGPDLSRQESPAPPATQAPPPPSVDTLRMQRRAEELERRMQELAEQKERDEAHLGRLQQMVADEALKLEQARARTYTEIQQLDQLLLAARQQYTAQRQQVIDDLGVIRQTKMGAIADLDERVSRERAAIGEIQQLLEAVRTSEGEMVLYTEARKKQMEQQQYTHFQRLQALETVAGQPNANTEKWLTAGKMFFENGGNKLLEGVAGILFKYGMTPGAGGQASAGEPAAGG